MADEPSLPPSWSERLALLTGGGSSPPALPGVAALAAVVVGVAVAGFLLLRGPSSPPAEVSLPVAGGPGDPSVSSTTATTAPAVVVVHAAGAVAAPGVYRLPGGSRVGDLVDAAGGAIVGADLDQVNLAAPVADGERVYVPMEGEVVAPASPGGSPPGPVDLNTATAADLEALPGIGPATASAILDERERRGRFSSVEDLLDVRGIGPAKLEQLRELVRV